MTGHDEKIIGQKVYLEKLSLAEATEKYCGWLNDPEVNKFLETRRATVTDLREYIKQHLLNPNSFFVGIFDKASNSHIGNVKLEPIDWNNHSAVFGILVGDKNYWGKGVGTEATKLIVDYAFRNLGLLKIRLGVIADNTKAAHVYEKIGFKTIEVKKGAVNHDGVLHDDIVMVLKKIDYHG